MPKNNLSRLYQIKSALSYYLRAITHYEVHSPLVFDFVENIFEDDRTYYIFEKIERLRKKLLRNTSIIKTLDFGAGSKSNNQPSKSIKAIASTSLSSQQYGKLLFKLINHYQLNTLLEIGTSLGITSLYLASARQSTSKLYTLEGNPAIAKVAQSNFNALELKNIALHTGQFENSLPAVLSKIDKVDFVFFDGNHQKEPTLSYFQQCLDKAHEQTVFVFDDIYWSQEMTDAWELIKQNKRVSHSIDLYQFGILFFRKKTGNAEHHTLISHKWKPWSAGFFG